MAGENGPGRRRQRWFEIRRPISARGALGLGIAIWVIFFALWELASVSGFSNPLLVPPPHQVLATLFRLFSGTEFPWDIVHSVLRVTGSFLLACLLAVPL